MHKLLNFLFGWDYIAWKNTATQGVARVHNDHNGNSFYWRHKNISCYDLITDKDQVLWLTCVPEKYMNPEFYN